MKLSRRIASCLTFDLRARSSAVGMRIGRSEVLFAMIIRDSERNKEKPVLVLVMFAY